jgi:hypothetical protein
MTVFVYINTSNQIGDVERIKVSANGDTQRKWFEENDPESVAFDMRFWNKCIRRHAGRWVLLDGHDGAPLRK